MSPEARTEMPDNDAALREALQVPGGFRHSVTIRRHAKTARVTVWRTRGPVRWQLCSVLAGRDEAAILLDELRRLYRAAGELDA